MIHSDKVVQFGGARQYIEDAPVLIAEPLEQAPREIVPKTYSPPRTAAPKQPVAAPSTPSTPRQNGTGVGITVNAPKAPEMQRLTETVATPVPAAGVRSVGASAALGLGAAPSAVDYRIVGTILALLAVVIFLGIAEDD